jgi:hypothetical protein
VPARGTSFLGANAPNCQGLLDFSSKLNISDLISGITPLAGCCCYGWNSAGNVFAETSPCGFFEAHNAGDDSLRQVLKDITR